MKSKYVLMKTIMKNNEEVMGGIVVKKNKKGPCLFYF